MRFLAQIALRDSPDSSTVIALWESDEAHALNKLRSLFGPELIVQHIEEKPLTNHLTSPEMPVE